MLIEKLVLKNFRNLNLEFIPSAKLNFVIGRNSTGKSNLLDSIYMCCHGRTYKEYLNQNNVNFRSNGSIENNFATIDVKAVNSRTFDLKMIFMVNGENESKRFILNEKPTIRGKFIYKYATIVFAPFNINFITGSPDSRRSEFDDFLSLVDLNYAITIQDYKQVIRSRNIVLKRISDGLASRSELDYWTRKMIDLGSRLTVDRENLIQGFNPAIKRFQKGKFKGIVEDLEIAYVSKFTGNIAGADNAAGKSAQIDSDYVRTLYEEKVSTNIDKEIAARQSLYGPHKDDYIVTTGLKDIKIYGSRGQQRIAVFLIKLAMWNYLYKVQKEKPILLLDDIMSELDKVNRIELEDILLELDTQIFLTAISRASIKHLIDDKEEYKIIDL